MSIVISVFEAFEDNLGYLDSLLLTDLRPEHRGCKSRPGFDAHRGGGGELRARIMLLSELAV